MHVHGCMGRHSPAHDFMCEENSAHLWVLVLSLIGYGLKGGNEEQESIKLSPPWLGGGVEKLTNLFSDRVDKACVEILLRTNT